MFKNWTKEEVTIFSSLLSALISLTVLFIGKYIEYRKRRSDKNDIIKVYANPLILSSELLAWRIKEILSANGLYLMPEASKNKFFTYKFDSTIYRLSSLLGWIQAIKKEQSYFEGFNKKQNRKIYFAINEFQKALADGSHVEISILEDLIKIFEINSDGLSESSKPLLSVQLEKILFEYISTDVKTDIILQSKDSQREILRKILDYICEALQQESIDEKLIEENLEKAIKEISREFCWIYRDWQAAIGDAMLEPITGAKRRYDVIGFGKFQKFHSEDEWLQKVNGLFKDLNVSIDQKYDYRVRQLKQVYSAIVNLINILCEVVDSQNALPKANVRLLNNFNREINPANPKIKKRKLRIKISYN
ncbi:hypothetical protein GWA97_05860 [Flavobacterium sp. LaA7.5]|nr:hypothetical protein [Flavobacterium salilacus subsp. altitudinum]